MCLPNYVCIPSQFHPQFFGSEMEIVLKSCDRCGFPGMTWRLVHAPLRNMNFLSPPRHPHTLTLCYLGRKAHVWVYVFVLLKHSLAQKRNKITHDGQGWTITRPTLMWQYCRTPWREQMSHVAYEWKHLILTLPDIKCPERLRPRGRFCSCPTSIVSSCAMLAWC